MSLNPRVNAPGGLEALGWKGELSAWQVVAYGAVEFDLSDANDLVTVNLGQAKQIEWYPVAVTAPDASIPQVFPGHLSAFMLEVYEPLQLSATAGVYDAAAEVSLNPPGTNGLVTAWIWPSSTYTLGDEDYTIPSRTEEFLMYEGSPIQPACFLRPGMISGVSPADSHFVWRFVLRALPQAAFGAARFRVPAPHCVPPFIAHGANKGTHIFQGHASKPLPQTQKMPFARQFRTVAFDTSASAVDPQIDARVFGGPWNGHMIGANDTGASGTSEWSIQSLLSQVADPLVLPYTPATIVTVSSSEAASLHTGPESLHDALRFTQSDDSNPGRTEILVDYPGV